MQRIDADLSIGTLGLRVIRDLHDCRRATTHGLAIRLHTGTQRMRSELNHLCGLDIVMLTEGGWTLSVEGVRAWARSLEDHLLGAAYVDTPSRNV